MPLVPKNSLKITALLMLVLLFSCNKKNSLNTSSYSDNKTFKMNRYSSNEPITPFGNLSNESYNKQKSIEYYEDYISTGMNNLKLNQDYMKWLAVQRKKRLKQGKLNGFKQESMPGLNIYYINKIEKKVGRDIKLNERIYFDIDRQVHNAINKDKAENDQEESNEIDEYLIKNNTINKAKGVMVKENQY